MRTEQSVNLSGEYQRISKMNRFYFKNEIYFTQELTPELLSMTRMHLPNLSDFSLEEDRAVFISPILDGVPLLQHEMASSSEKVELINAYLQIVMDFQDLPLFMQLNLLRPENFYMVHGELKHRGILIVEDVDFRYLPSAAHMRKSISRVVMEIIGKDVSLFNFKNYFRNLPSNTTIDKVQQIVEDVKDIYINDLFVEKNFQVEETKVVTSAWGHVNIKFVVLALAFLFFLMSAFFAFYKTLSYRVTQDLYASFTLERRDSSFLLLDTSFAPSNVSLTGKRWTLHRGNELLFDGDVDNLNHTPTEGGTFTATLRVRDSQDNWSPPFTQTFSFTPYSRSLDEIEHYSWSSASFSEEMSMTGSKSLLFDQESSAQIDNIYLEGNVSLHFYVRSDESRMERVRLEGFRQGSRLVLQEEDIFISADEWKEITLEMSAPPLDALRISFPDAQAAVFLDVLQINSVN